MGRYSIRITTFLIAALVFQGCGVVEQKKAKPTDKVELLRSLHSKRAAAAKTIQDEFGWITTDCDGMIWNGKLAIVRGVGEVDILAAEYSDEEGVPNGRFDRQPAERCWDRSTETKIGSESSWSRDMGICGLLPYALFTGDLATVERHITYGQQNSWQMGRATSAGGELGRTQYVPTTYGMFYQARFTLGGADHPARIWPGLDWYASGLDDYHAHLQMCNIMARGEMASRRNEANALPKKPPEGTANLLDIGGILYNRVEEHAKRQADCPFYNYLFDLYRDGDFNHTIDILLADQDPSCDYIRCGGQMGCFDAEWLYASELVLRKFDGNSAQ